jgi:hypothetical protein
MLPTLLLRLAYETHECRASAIRLLGWDCWASFREVWKRILPQPALARVRLIAHRHLLCHR